MNKPTLTVNLFRGWFYKIYNGEKLEEYRAITPYWCSRLLTYGTDKGEELEFERMPLNWWKATFKACEGLPVGEGLIFKTNPIEHIKSMIRIGVVRFEYYEEMRCLNGMNPPVPEFRIEVKNVKIGKGRKPWGATKGVDYFVIGLDGQTVKESKNVQT